MDKLIRAQEALCDFIIRASKEEAPAYAVQALPEATKSLIELMKVTRSLK